MTSVIVAMASANNAGLRCPYCEDSNFNELKDLGKTAEEDDESKVNLEWWFHSMGCQNWFLAIRDGASGNILGVIHHHKDWNEPAPS
jgi:sarcosine oxidase delta subunit